MNFFSLILGLLLLIPVGHTARDCKTERWRTVGEQLARLDPKIDLDIIDYDMFPGGSFVAGYEYEVEPAYTNGLYSRTDRWQIGLKAVPEKLKTLEEGIDAKLFGGFDNQTEATFVRFVKDPCLAMRLDPYTPKKIPLKTEIAIGNKFKIGDYFLFRASLGFVVGADILGMLSSNLWAVGLSGSYLVEGYFQLHIVRLDEKHIRLKVVGHRGRKINATLGVGWEGEFDVFGVNQLNNQLEKFVNLKPVKLKADFNKSNVFMVDYVLDLTDPEVSVAFESVIRNIKEFKNIKKILKKEKNLEANVLLDLTALEELYQSDRMNDRVGRLRRNLNTNANQNARAFGLDLGNKLIGYKWYSDVATSLMSVKRSDNTLDKYLLKTWGGNWEGRFFYSWVKSSEKSGLRALFHTDEFFKNLVPINIVSFITQRKNRISFKSFKDVKLRLKKSIPIDVFLKIPWESWPQGKKDSFTNFGLRYELMMAPEGITEAPELSAEEIKVLFNDHILSKGLTYKDYFRDTFRGPRNERIPAKVTYDRSLKAFAKNLSKVLDQKLDSVERLNHLTELRKNTLFDESGFSFLMALRPDKIDDWYHLDVNLSSNEAEINHNFGETELSILYKKLLSIKAALDDDSLDIMREAESISSLPPNEEVLH